MGEPQRKKRKRGRKSNAERQEHEELMHHFLIGFFSDQSCPSLRGYCRVNEAMHLRGSMRQFIGAHPRLKQIANGDRRTQSDYRQEALAIIQRRYPAPVSGGEEDSESIERSEAVSSQRVSRAKLTIFHFEELKRIALSLNFASPTRHSRDDPTMEIQLHDRRNADATMRFMIFDLANRVMAKSKLSVKERTEVLGYAAAIVFYDHGYKSVRGVSNLDRLWRRRLTLAHLKGNDTSPLTAKHKGSTSYTDKLESQHPGYVRELFRLAQKEIGNQATFRELAECMNVCLRTDERPDTVMNTANLYR